MLEIGRKVAIFGDDSRIGVVLDLPTVDEYYGVQEITGGDWYLLLTEEEFVALDPAL